MSTIYLLNFILNVISMSFNYDTSSFIFSQENLGIKGKIFDSKISWKRPKYTLKPEKMINYLWKMQTITAICMYLDHPYSNFFFLQAAATHLYDNIKKG